MTRCVPTVEIPVALWDQLQAAAKVARAIRITQVPNGKIAIGGGLDPLFFVRGERSPLAQSIAEAERTLTSTVSPPRLDPTRCPSTLGDRRCIGSAGHEGNHRSGPAEWTSEPRTEDGHRVRCPSRMESWRCNRWIGHDGDHETTRSAAGGFVGWRSAGTDDPPAPPTPTPPEEPLPARGVIWPAERGEDLAARQCPSRRGDYVCQRTSGHTGTHQCDDQTGTTYWSRATDDPRCLAQHASANCQKIRGHLGPHAGYTRGPLVDWPEPEPDTP